MSAARTFADRSLGAILARVMALAPSLQNRLATHAGKVIGIHAGPARISFEILASGALAPAASQSAADLTLMLNPLSPLRMEGDAELASALSALLGNAQAQIEEGLNRAVGEILARRVVLGLRSLAQEMTLTRQRTLAAVGDYLSGEMNLLPMKTELHEFAGEAIQLHDDVDGLAARIEKLRHGALAP